MANNWALYPTKNSNFSQFSSKSTLYIVNFINLTKKFNENFLKPPQIPSKSPASEYLQEKSVKKAWKTWKLFHFTLKIKSSSNRTANSLLLFEFSPKTAWNSFFNPLLPTKKLENHSKDIRNSKDKFQSRCYRAKTFSEGLKKGCFKDKIKRKSQTTEKTVST